LTKPQIIEEAAWTTQTLLEAISILWKRGQKKGGLDIQDISKIVEDLEAYPATILYELKNRLAMEIQNQVEEQELCPNCFHELEDCNIVEEDGGKVPQNKGCPECGYMQ